MVSPSKLWLLKYEMKSFYYTKSHNLCYFANETPVSPNETVIFLKMPNSFGKTRL